MKKKQVEENGNGTMNAIVVKMMHIVLQLSPKKKFTMILVPEIAVHNAINTMKVKGYMTILEEIVVRNISVIISRKFQIQVHKYCKTLHSAYACQYILLVP
jgi:hypothetical protein